MPDDFLARMFSLVKEAGEVSLTVIEDSAPDLKPDQSIITKADKAISALTRQRLGDYLQHDDHLLLDEEDPRISSYLNKELINHKKYVWALDPIDGTRLYANRMPLFGISLGLIKDLKPWLGVVYFPMLKELFYCDGDKAYFVRNAFTANEIKVEIKLNTETVSPKSLFFCNDTFFDKFYWDDKDFHIMIHACAVVNLCWPTIGRGIGCFLRCHIWDFAGCWPIIQRAGFQLYRLSDNQVMSQINTDDYTNHQRPWQLKEYYLITTAANAQAIKSKIVKR